MRTSMGEALARGRSIPLGIRVAVSGSRAFCRQMYDLLTADPDVAFVQELDNFGRMNEGFLRVNALITEPEIPQANLSNDQVEWLGSISLIAVIGSSLGRFAGFSNAQRFPAIDPHWGTLRLNAIKDRILQIRFQEFYGLVNALVTDQMDATEEEEPILELEEDGADKRVPISSIDWIRAAGNHVEIRVSGQSHFHRSEMHTLERRLPSGFLRIHRKIIINLNRLLRIDADSSVRQFATMITGERFLISRHRRTLVHARWAELRGHSA